MNIMKIRINTKIVLPFILILVFTASIGFSFGKETTFFDVPKDHWAYESIEKIYEEGIISGYPDGSFRPEEKVTYGEFLKMLAVATGAAREREESYGDHWALPFYNACLNNFYFTDWDISENKLNQKIPRKDMALAASGSMGNLVKISDYGDYGEVMDEIIDLDQRHSHEFHIVKSYITGVLTGYPDGSFRPDDQLTRAEATSVIWRLKELLEGIEKEISEKEGDKKEDKLEEQEEKPLVEKWVDPAGYPEGSLEFIIFDYHENTLEKHKEMERLLIANFPEYGQEMFEVFDNFMSKPISKGGVGLRKQYFGQIPVFMEHMSNSATVNVLPVGYDDPFWELKPGQIEEHII